MLHRADAAEYHQVNVVIGGQGIDAIFGLEILAGLFGLLQKTHQLEPRYDFEFLLTRQRQVKRRADLFIFEVRNVFAFHERQQRQPDRTRVGFHRLRFTGQSNGWTGSQTRRDDCKRGAHQRRSETRGRHAEDKMTRSSGDVVGHA